MTAMAGLTYQVRLWSFKSQISSRSSLICSSNDRCHCFLFLFAASGDSSMEREFTGALGGPTVSTPNSKETSPTRSLSGQ